MVKSDCDRTETSLTLFMFTAFLAVFVLASWASFVGNRSRLDAIEKAQAEIVDLKKKLAFYECDQTYETPSFPVVVEEDSK